MDIDLHQPTDSLRDLLEKNFNESDEIMSVTIKIIKTFAIYKYSYKKSQT